MLKRSLILYGLYERHLRQKEYKRIEIKRVEKLFQANLNQRKVRVLLLVSSKVEVKDKCCKDNGVCFILKRKYQEMFYTGKKMKNNVY